MSEALTPHGLPAHNLVWSKSRQAAGGDQGAQDNLNIKHRDIPCGVVLVDGELILI